MECPYCGKDSNVLDSRSSSEGTRRRRQCVECKRRFTTYEKPSAPTLRIKKRSGDTEPFDRQKLLVALARVCRHRPMIQSADIDRIARDIEAQLIDAGTRSVASGEIASRAIDRLREIDSVACQRLMANYLDEGGQLRFEQKSPSDRSQLGLFSSD